MKRSFVSTARGTALQSTLAARAGALHLLHVHRAQPPTSMGGTMRPFSTRYGTRLDGSASSTGTRSSRY